MNTCPREITTRFSASAGTPDDQQIKGAYRRLALKHHPDRNPENPDAEEKFKEASEAYSVLSDPQKRAAYDRFGHAGLQGRGQQGFNPDAFADFSDILGDFFGFGDLFGRGAAGGVPRRSAAKTRSCTLLPGGARLPRSTCVRPTTRRSSPRWSRSTQVARRVGWCSRPPLTRGSGCSC